MTERPVIGIGLMSGTSLDGMDAALVRFHGPMHAELLGFVTRPYTASERDQVRHGISGAGARDLALLHARLAFAASSASERRDWRVLFDHYVFGDEDVAGHIPEGRRGVLGELDAAALAALRERIKSGL